MTEQWKAVPGWEGLYSVSSLGNVRREPRTSTCTARNRWGQVRQRVREYRRALLKVNLDSGGYAQVVLQQATTGRRETCAVHRLVLSAFRRLPGPDDHGMHRNDIRHDNRLSNLKWGTRVANAKDMAKKGRARRVPSSRPPLSTCEVQAIQAEPLTKREDLAERFGTSKSNISKIRAKAKQ